MREREVAAAGAAGARLGVAAVAAGSDPLLYYYVLECDYVQL